MITMIRKKKEPVPTADHAEDTKAQALQLIEEIREKLAKLEPLVADGAMDEGEQARDVG